ncbi:type II CAAX endopeptidase family protein [Haloplanus rubicundus]|uniref:CPBP family intramembrane metalloprotease n=1 Tax=Haloplanus rubicundus TaxID=1547898 RepID=A0A345EEG1_9EURY|nr:type II CAAX endopeptidase family protein [Haloplanus rubicundus]AXG10583.1 CPBP family intramembrane metalloprotease [Haloplanus rubicundus]
MLIDEARQEHAGATGLSVGSPWTFFVVTYAITWAFWLPAIVFDVSFSTVEGVALLVAGLAGPGLGGIGFTYLVYDDRGRADFWIRLRSLRRVGLKWVLVIAAVPLALSLLAAGVDRLFGGVGATWAEGVVGFAANPLTILPTLFFVTLPPFLEELGWRGYVLDRLQLRWSALGSGVILGVAWSLWHLPLFFVADTYQSGLGVGTPEFWLFFVSVVPLSMALSWVYNNTSRSILAAILLHSSANFSGEIVAITPRADVYNVGLWVLFAVVIVAIWGGKTLAGADEVPKPPRPARR